MTLAGALLLLGSATVKSSVLLGIVALIARLTRRASASARHLVWALALGAAVAMPVAELLVPRWETSRLGVRAPELLRSEATPAHSTAAVPPRSDQTPASLVANGPRRNESGLVRRAEGTPGGGARWVAGLLIAWIAGALIVILGLLYGRWTAAAFARRSPACSDPRLLAQVQASAAELAIRRLPPVRLSGWDAVPFVIGVIRPVLVLPGRATSWIPERLRPVLLHELAHVRRHDGIVQTVADLATAMYWFHPAVWLAAARLRRERELACDDVVVAAGVGAAAYARELLELAQSGSASLPASVFAAARPGSLAGRIVAILDPQRPRRSSPRSAAGAAFTIVSLQLAVAGYYPWQDARPVQDSARRLVARPVLAAPGPGTAVDHNVSARRRLAVPAASDNSTVNYRVASRAGVCGQGRPDEITFDNSPRPSSERCARGDARITATTRDGRIVDGHAVVGDGGDASVRAPEARQLARELLASIPGLDGSAAARLVQAAAVMQDGAAAQDLLDIVQNESLAPAARRMAVTWFDIVAGPAGEPSLVAVARRDGADPSVREQCLIALGPRGVETALSIAETSRDPAMRRAAFHRAALQLAAADLVRLYPGLRDEALRMRVVEGVAGSNDSTAKRALAGLIQSDTSTTFRARGLARLGG